MKIEDPAKRVLETARKRPSFPQRKLREKTPIVISKKKKTPIVHKRKKSKEKGKV